MRCHGLALLVLFSLLPPDLVAAESNTLWVADASQAARIRRVERGLPAVSLTDGQSLQMDLQQ